MYVCMFGGASTELIFVPEKVQITCKLDQQNQKSTRRGLWYNPVLNLPQFSIALVKCTFRLSLLHNCKTSGLVLIRDHRSNAYKLILSLQ